MTEIKETLMIKNQFKQSKIIKHHNFSTMFLVLLCQSVKSPPNLFHLYLWTYSVRVVNDTSGHHTCKSL